ncbi:MAG TPA: orotidine-5'-phosphate decarboxylase, partial [Candidatus Omnitrophota bacterium]|nr:orotidine-5'-phosphate decarboxylase [Candidatus Omnitrophota bacterium]
SLRGLVGGIKLGLEFYTANGPAAVEQVSALGMPVFLDLKLHDIPNTVAGGMKGVARLKPALTTIHASGGSEMMKAAVASAREHSPATKVLAVTILTSIDQAAMTEIGYPGAVADQVLRLAELAKASGIDGLVCSPHEVEAVRRAVGPGMTLVVPGIRPAWAEAGDQKRIMTPRQAIERGADVLVIGRPITGASDPAEAARKIAEELAP